MQKYRKKQRKAIVPLPNYYIFSDGLLPYLTSLFLYPNNSVSVYFVAEFIMKTLNENLKVSFYFKKNVSRKGLCPVTGRITIGKDMAQFSCKLETDPNLWDTCAGRMNGKSKHASLVNRDIDKINVALNTGYREIVSLRGHAAAAREVKYAFQGIASSQETLLKIFREHNTEYEKRTGVNIAIGTLGSYKNSYFHLGRFIHQKYHVSDISFKQLDYSFIENYDYYLRIDVRMMPNTVRHRMICLRKIIRIAIGRGIINHNPFSGYSVELPKGCQRFLPADELERLRDVQLNSSALEIVCLFVLYRTLLYRPL